MATICEVPSLSNSGRMRRKQRRTYTHAPYTFAALEERAQQSQAHLQQAHLQQAPVMTVTVAAPLPAMLPVAVLSELKPIATACAADAHTEAPATGPASGTVFVDELLKCSVGHFAATALTAHGSSYLQSALRDDPARAFDLIAPEVLPQAATILLNQHGCYVVKVLLERLDHAAAVAFIHDLAKDQKLMVQLCTASLHSRRMIQFFLELCGPVQSTFMYTLLLEHFFEIVCSQQGCITAQRILDQRTPQERERAFDIVRVNLLATSCDAFGNYIVQYLFEQGDVAANSAAVASQFVGSMVWLSTQKYASNAVEKALEHITFDLQRVVINEVMSAPEEVLLSLLLDNFANYILQAIVRVAPHRDIGVIAHRLLPLLRRVPYGRKMEQRILRRLHGKVSPA